MRIDDPVYQPTGSKWKRFIAAILLALENWDERKRQNRNEMTAWWTRLERLSK